MLARTSTGVPPLRIQPKAKLTWQPSVFEAELQDVVPICRTTIAGTRIIGRMTAGCVNSIFAGYRSLELTRAAPLC